MQRSATLIDNIFISPKLQQSYDSALLLADISNHLPLLTLVKQSKLRNKEPIAFQSRGLTEGKISQIKHDLSQHDWNGILNSEDCNTNFNTLSATIDECMNKIAPLTTIRISGKRKFTEPWLTRGIEEANRKNTLLYKKTLKQGCTDDDVHKYREHRNVLNCLRHAAKTNYYWDGCQEYKTNTKKLWQLINQTISKCKINGSIMPFLTVDGMKTYNPLNISNTFGKFYSSLGQMLAATITLGKYPINHYIQKIPRTVNSLVLALTSQLEIETLVNKLPNKSSFGHDQISNGMLKSLCKAISYPLTMVFNQSILQGIFPDIMK